MVGKEPAGVPRRAFPIGGFEEVFNLDPKSAGLRGGASFIAKTDTNDQNWCNTKELRRSC